MKKYLLKKISRWREKYARIIDIDKKHAVRHGLDNHDCQEQKTDEALNKIKLNKDDDTK